MSAQPRRRTYAGDMATMARCNRRHPQPPCSRCASTVDAREPSGDLILCTDDVACAMREQAAIAEAQAIDDTEVFG